jgi:tetratricopeptide (TPR) repeat protein
LLQIDAVSATLSRAVIQSLHVDAQQAQLSAFDRRLTEDPEAYQLHFLGRYYSAPRTRDSLQESVKLLERAVKLDPKFADAFAALGWSYYELSMRVGAAWAPEMGRSMEAARSALILNRNLADGYLVVACNQRQWEWDWPAAEQDFRRSLALNENHAITYRFYAHMVSRLGRYTEAIKLIDHAIALDPLDPSNHLARGTIFLYGGRADNALEEYQSVLQSDPGDPNLYIPMADALEKKGQMKAAVAACERAIAMTNRASPHRTALASELSSLRVAVRCGGPEASGTATLS